MQTLTQRIHLEKDEKIIAVIRKHWFVLFARCIVPLLFLFFPLILPIVGLFFFKYFTVTSISLTFESSFELLKSMLFTSEYVFFSALWSLFIWMTLFYIWTDFYLDIWTITNRRIIAIDQRGLFNRSISSFRFERLQDINIEINGIIQTFLDFGSLEAQTAGHSESEFQFRGAPKPREMKALILRSADELATQNRSGSPSSSSENADV